MKILKKEISKSFTVDIQVKNKPVYQLKNKIVSHNTSSLVLGTSSGIHAWHNDFYLRRIRVGKAESIYSYLSLNHPELIEDEYFRPHDTAVITIPQKAPENSSLRTESIDTMLERIKRFNIEWVRNGHNRGVNYHNVSATVSVKDNEWEKLREWMWENKNHFHGLSVLPYSDHTYIQAPFEDITKEKYEELITHLTEVNLTRIKEMEDHTNLQNEAACAGGQCEIF